MGDVDNAQWRKEACELSDQLLHHLLIQLNNHLLSIQNYINSSHDVDLGDSALPAAPPSRNIIRGPGVENHETPEIATEETDFELINIATQSIMQGQSTVESMPKKFLKT